MLQKVVFLEILKSPLLTGVQAYSLYTSKNELTENVILKTLKL